MSKAKDIKDACKEYVLSYHESDLLKILRSEDKVQHFSITLNFVSLFERSSLLGDGLLSSPEEHLVQCDISLREAQAQLLLAQPLEVQPLLSVKNKIHTRIAALPSCPELHRTVFPKNEDTGSFLRVTGTVVRTSSPKMLEYQRIFRCRKCKHDNIAKADYEQHYAITTPRGCRNPDGCEGTNFATVQPTDGLNYKDYQEIKIQEQVGKLSVGTMPRSMLVTLEDDLVDSCKPGDDVIICGTVLRRWRSLGANKRSDVELVLRANHLQVCNDQRAAVLVTRETQDEAAQFWAEHAMHPLRGRDLILASICPQVFGLYVVKLAVACVLAGGVAQQQVSGGTRVRGESHLLLVGDPGTAKSHLLRFAARLSPRSVLTTGIGSTAAGLTVTALMEGGGDWQLEAGALVLADGGVCCIDEFNSIREHDRASIHEAMEQQTISVAKAGLVCKLNTRCTVLAATNPKGKYDPGESISVNIAVASPLLSRFDLVLVLLDSSNAEWDRVVSSYILNGKQPGKMDDGEDLWALSRLQAYFCLIKRLQPRLSLSANRILSCYYQAQRKADERSAARTTVRLLESLIRLSQAHARLLFREEVTRMDAVVAVSLMEASMQNSALLQGANVYHTAFPRDPMLSYRSQATAVLGRLGLDDELQEELAWLESLNKSQPSQGPSAGTHPRDDAQLPELSSPSGQDRLANLLSNIRRNKDRAALQAANQQRLLPDRKQSKEPKAGPSGVTSRKSNNKRPVSSSSDSSNTEIFNKSSVTSPNIAKPARKRAIIESDEDIPCDEDDVFEQPTKKTPSLKQFAFQKKSFKKLDANKATSDSPVRKETSSEVNESAEDTSLSNTSTTEWNGKQTDKQQRSSDANRRQVEQQKSPIFNRRHVELQKSPVVKHVEEHPSSPIVTRGHVEETSPVVNGNHVEQSPVVSDNKVEKSPRLSTSTLDKLQRFKCLKSNNASPVVEGTTTNNPSCEITDDFSTPSVTSTPYPDEQNKRLEDLIQCGKQLSQLSRFSQSSQSPLLKGARHPFLACDDDDFDLDLTL